jgi:hypothetical protein
MQKTNSFLVFTNKSTNACTMRGFPGVSFVRGTQGEQVNDPARRTDDRAEPVDMVPGARAYARVTTLAVEAVDNCQPVKVEGWRVFPPDSKTAVFVEAPQTACSVKGNGVPSVGAVHLGPPPV